MSTYKNILTFYEGTARTTSGIQPRDFGTVASLGTVAIRKINAVKW